MVKGWNVKHEINLEKAKFERIDMEIEIRKAIAMSDVIQTININHNAYKNSKQK